MTARPDELYRRAAAGFGLRVHAVRGHQWELATPCSEWNVRALVNHVVGEIRWVPELFAGRTVDGVGDGLDGDLLGVDPVAAWEESVSASLAAIEEDGSLQRIVHMSFGDVPASEYVTRLFAELLVHSWDLARSIGADERLDGSLITACSAWFAGVAEQYRSAGAVGPAGIAGSADPQTRLLADLGRSPGAAAARATGAPGAEKATGAPPHDPGEWWCIDCAKMHRGSHYRHLSDAASS